MKPESGFKPSETKTMMPMLKWAAILFVLICINGSPMTMVANGWEVIGDVQPAGPYMQIHRLSNDEVLLFGSLDTVSDKTASFVVNMRTKDLKRVGDLKATCEGFTSAKTPNGLIYAFGGGKESSYTKSVERYDPFTESWEIVGEILVGRQCLSAIALSNTLILIVGGKDSIYTIPKPVDQTRSKILNTQRVIVGSSA